MISLTFRRSIASSNEELAATILSPILRDLHAAHPRIRIELEAASELRDLAGGAADIALRSGEALKGNGLVGRRVG